MGLTLSHWTDAAGQSASGPTTIRGGHVEKFTINLSNVDAAGLSDRDIIVHVLENIVHVLENGGTHDHIVGKL